MKYRRWEYGGITVIRPEVKKIDAGVAVEFKAALYDLIRQGSIRLLIHMADVDFIDSSGLGVLVSILRAAEPDGRIAVCEVKENVRTILDLTSLEKVLNIYGSLEEGIESFSCEN